MTSLYLKLGAGLLIALGVFGVGWKAGSSRWETKYQALQTADWQGRAVAEKVLRTALEAQLAQARRVAKSNEESLNELHATAAAIAADRDHTRDLVRRLLASQARSAAGTHRVPEATNQSGAPTTGEAGGHVEVEELLADVADECRATAAQLNALIAQIRPQL